MINGKQIYHVLAGLLSALETKIDSRKHMPI